MFNHINKFIKFITFGKFYIDIKKDILIFDAQTSSFIENFLKADQFNFFYTRREKYEIRIFLYTIIKSGFKNFSENYFGNYIKNFNPKYIISMWVLNKNLFKIKENFPEIKVIIIQGHRFSKQNYQIMSDYPKNSVDLFFTYRDLDNFKLKTFFKDAKIISIGSLKNNYYYKSVPKKNKILFFSEYKTARFTHEEKNILISLNKYCEKNKSKFDIQIRYENTPKEYLKFLEENQIKNYDKILGRYDYSSSYNNSNIYKILVLTDSTLNDEFISNFKRVAIFSSHKDLDSQEYESKNFGKLREISFENPMYQEMLPENFSWTSSLNTEKIDQVLDNIHNCSDLEWNNHISKYKNRFLFDSGNKIFKEQMKKIGVII